MNKIDIIELEKFLLDKSIFSKESIDFSRKNLFKKVKDIFFFDYLRYFPNDNQLNLDNVINWGGALLAILNYRISREFYLANDEKSALMFSNIGKFFSGTEIFYSAKIGKGLRINHGVGTVIGARCSIGNNALIHQGVTIGDKNGQRPIIGDNVVIYAGAKVLGGINIGHNSVIGANTVCFIDVPDGKRAVGIPAKLV